MDDRDGGIVDAVSPVGDVLSACGFINLPDAASCNSTALPCYTGPDPFTCQPKVCKCESGGIRCEDIPPGTFGGTRHCLADWTCTSGAHLVCNGDKVWYTCRCTAEGKWECGDECRRRGCPGLVPARLRAHTGELCTTTEECPYQLFSPPGRVICRCVDGRFQCPDEPPPDAGAADAARD